MKAEDNGFGSRELPIFTNRHFLSLIESTVSTRLYHDIDGVRTLFKLASTNKPLTYQLLDELRSTNIEMYVQGCVALGFGGFVVPQIGHPSHIHHLASHLHSRMKYWEAISSRMTGNMTEHQAVVSDSFHHTYALNLADIIMLGQDQYQTAIEMVEKYLEIDAQNEGFTSLPYSGLDSLKLTPKSISDIYTVQLSLIRLVGQINEQATTLVNDLDISILDNESLETLRTLTCNPANLSQLLCDPVLPEPAYSIRQQIEIQESMLKLGESTEMHSTDDFLREIFTIIRYARSHKYPIFSISKPRFELKSVEQTAKEAFRTGRVKK
jgi:hypothetical protein